MGIAGGGSAASTGVYTPVVMNFPVAISANIMQGDIGTGSSQQTESSSATGGSATVGVNFSGLGLMNLDGLAWEVA